MTFSVATVALKRQARRTDREVVLIPYNKHGLPLGGNGVSTSDSLLQENPGLVWRFVKATLEAAAGAVDNPTAATDHFLQWNATNDRDIPVTNEGGGGHLCEIWNFWKEAALIIEDSGYTNGFLPGIFPPGQWSQSGVAPRLSLIRSPGKKGAGTWKASGGRFGLRRRFADFSREGEGPCAG